MAARLARIRPKLTSDSPQTRQAGYAAFRGAGGKGRRLLRQWLLEIRDSLVVRCRAFALDGATQHEMLEVHGVYAQVRDRARQAADGAKGQEAAAEASAQLMVAQPIYERTFAPVLRRFVHVARAYERIKEVDAELERCGETGALKLHPSLAEILGPSIEPALVEILLGAVAAGEAASPSAGRPRAERPSPGEPSPAQPEPHGELAAKLRRHSQNLTSRNPKARLAAYEAFRSAGADGQALLVQRLLAIRKGLVARCRALYLADRTQDKLLKLAKALEEARQRARTAIFEGSFDKAKVRATCDELKKIHDFYKRVFFPVLRRFRPVVHACERLKELDQQLANAGYDGGIALQPPLRDVLAGKLKAELVDVLLKAYAFERLAARCLIYNRLVRTTASGGEREVVRLTNEHRIRLGFQPLLINELLVRAARAHSAEMRALGYFSHTSPVAGNRSFGQRARREGYPSARGENIMSGGGPAAAYWAWFYSAGHHRNMANPGHNEIGVGHGGPWTEVLGTRKDIDLEHPPRQWPRPATRPTPKPARGRKPRPERTRD